MPASNRRRQALGLHVEAALAAAAVFVAFAVLDSRLTPLGGAPDELSHLAYVRGVAAHLHLPTAAMPEKQQPPLYYVLGAGVYRLTADPQAVRLVGVVLGLVTLAAIFVTARWLFPPRPWLAAGAVAVFALLPEVQYISGAVNDDSIAWCAGALVVLLLVAVAQRSVLTPRLELAAGVVAGFALLSKETAWVLLLILGITLLVRHGARLRPSSALRLLLPPLLIAGWWFVRNLLTFHALLPPLRAITRHRQVLHSLTQVRGFVAQTVDSLVGMYGNGTTLTVIATPSRRPVPSALIEAGAALLLLRFAYATVQQSPRWTSAQRGLAVLLGLVALAVVVQSLVNSVSLDLQPQGRYLLVAAGVGAPAVAWTLAWRRSGPLTWARGLVLACGVGGALFLDATGAITAARVSV